MRVLIILDLGPLKLKVNFFEKKNPQIPSNEISIVWGLHSSKIQYFNSPAQRCHLVITVGNSLGVNFDIYDFLKLIGFVYLVVYGYMDIRIISQICDRKIEEKLKWSPIRTFFGWYWFWKVMSFFFNQTVKWSLYFVFDPY